MFCTNCGAQMTDQAEFCTNCGKKLQTGTAATTVGKKKGKKLNKYLMTVLCLLVLAGGFWYYQSDFRQELLYKWGVQALSKQDYQKAESCYQRMKKANAEDEATYLFGADVYLAQDRWEEAIYIIEEGMEVTGSERLKNRRGYICENVVVLNGKTTDMYDNIDRSISFEYDQWGNMTEYVRLQDGEVYEQHHYEYDAKGNVVKCVGKQSYSSNEYKYGYEQKYDYDKKGRLVQKAVKISPGWETVAEYEYDKVGNLIKIKEGNSEKRYDERGNLLVSIWYEDEGRSTTEYKYDAAGRRTEVVIYDTDGVVWVSWERDYDTGREISYRKDGTVSYEEEYDENENLIEETSYDEAGTTNYRYKYKYDANGNCIEEIEYDSDGDTRKYEYAYDANGNCIEEIHYDSDGDTYKYGYTYDDRGYLTKEVLEYGERKEEFRQSYTLTGCLINAYDSDAGEQTLKYEFTYIGDILCLNDIAPISGMIEIKTELTGALKGGNYGSSGAYANMRRIPSLRQGTMMYTHLGTNNGYCVEWMGEVDDLFGEIDKQEQNMLGSDDETCWEVIGETGEFYQLANGWYVEKNQPGIVFTQQ